MAKEFIFRVLLLIFVNFNHAIEAITGPQHGKVVVCYLGTWAVYRPNSGSFSIEHLDPSLCTHIIYAFAGLNVKEDSMRSLDEWQDLADNYGKNGYLRMTDLKQRYPHLKVSLAIGGWNEGSANYSTLVRSPERRGKFIASAIQFVKKFNFDGLDLDWEFPGKRGGSPDDKLNFLLLVKELRAAFKKHNLLLTAAFGAGKDTIDIAYDVEGLSLYLDFIHMMCYDYHGAWDQRIGANAPLRSNDVLNVEFSIDYMLKLGASPHKLVLGVPLYGRTFLLSEPITDTTRKPKLGLTARNIGFQGPYTRENGFMGYNEICLEFRNTSSVWHKYWDSETETPYAINGDRVITYDNERSIERKIRLAMEKNLAGIMVWSIDTDDFRGDCVEDGNRFENYPLMRSINRDIQRILKDIERDRENTIVHGHDQHKTSTSCNLHLYNSLIYLVVVIIAHYL